MRAFRRISQFRDGTPCESIGRMRGWRRVRNAERRLSHALPRRVRPRCGVISPPSGWSAPPARRPQSSALSPPPIRQPGAGTTASLVSCRRPVPLVAVGGSQTDVDDDLKVQISIYIFIPPPPPPPPLTPCGDDFLMVSCEA